jgi:hypothetical protein
MRWVNPEYSSGLLEGPDGSVWLMQLKVSRDELTRVLAMYSANEYLLALGRLQLPVRAFAANSIWSGSWKESRGHAQWHRKANQGSKHPISLERPCVLPG